MEEENEKEENKNRVSKDDNDQDQLLGVLVCAVDYLMMISITKM